MQIPSPTSLLAVFDLDSNASFLEVDEVAAEQVPEPHRGLLVHHNHMTVAMEAHHGTKVNVQVLQVAQEGSIYTREILLKRQSDGVVVQYGIARLHLECFPAPVRHQVLAQEKPLGAILIQHDLFREVQLGSLWAVKPGPGFRSRCKSGNATTYGRTALIHLNSVPAIELLEIVV